MLQNVAIRATFLTACFEVDLLFGKILCNEPVSVRLKKLRPTSGFANLPFNFIEPGFWSELLSSLLNMHWLSCGKKLVELLSF